MRRINSAVKRRTRENLCHSHGGRCAYCNRVVKLRDGTVDHYLPQALGGTNARENLRWACAGCNQSKADMHPDEWEQRRPLPEPDPVSLRAQLLRRIAEKQQCQRTREA